MEYIYSAMVLYSAGKDITEEMTDSDILEVRKKVGMVFQNPDNQIVATIVEEDVAFGPENLGIEPKEIRKRVDEALKTVGMYEFKNHAPHLLSGGQKQRISIARALLKDAPILILDDSVSAVDTKTERKILDNLKNTRKGKTTILIAHRITTIEHMDKVLFIDDGKVVAFDTHDNLINTCEEYKKMVDLQKLEDEIGGEK